MRISLGEKEFWAFVMICVGMTLAKSTAGTKQDKTHQKTVNLGARLSVQPPSKAQSAGSVRKDA